MSLHDSYLFFPLLSRESPTGQAKVIQSVLSRMTFLQSPHIPLRHSSSLLIEGPPGKNKGKSTTALMSRGRFWYDQT